MRAWVLPFCLSVTACGALAAEGAAPLQTVEVVGHTVLDATGVPLNEVPSNAQVLDARQAAEQGSYHLADALNNALGSVSVSNGTGNPYQNDVNYRGYQATSQLGAPVGLSVYFDGVRMNEPFGSNVNWELIPMNAIDSINVLPGSNPMFGLNTLGGALVIKTRNGKDDAGITITGLAGSFRRSAGEIEAGWVSAEGLSDHFLSADIDAQAGYRAHSASRVARLYGKSRWRAAGGRTEVELSAAFADTRVSGTQSLPMDMMADMRAAYTSPDTGTHRTGFVNLKGSHSLGEGSDLSGNVYFRGLRAGNVNSNAGLDDGCFNSDGTIAAAASVAGLVTYKCGDKAPNGTALNAVTNAAALALGYGRWTSSINTSLVESATHEHTVGAALQWTRVAEIAGRKNALYLGFLADRSQIGFSQDTTLARLVDYQVSATPNLAYGFTSNGSIPSLANPPAFTGSNVLTSVRLAATQRNVALYASDTLHLSPRFTVTASASLSHSALDQSGRNAQFLNEDGGYSWTDDVSGVTYYNPAYVPAYKYSNSGTGVAARANGIPTGGVAGPESNSLDGRHRYSRFNPALGFNRSLGAATNLFGSYSESLRAPTSIELSCADPQHPCSLPTGFNGDPDLQAVIARTFEFGGRGKWGAHLSWNAALYRSRISHDIQFIATSNTYGYFANVGDTERRGMELGLDAHWGKWRLSGAVAQVDAVYRSEFVTAAGEQVVSGNRIPGVPASTAKLRAVYTATPRLTLGGLLVAAGSQYAHGNESNADAEGKVAGHAVLNLDAHYKLSDALRLSAYVNNALDRRYSTYGLSGLTSLYTLVTQQFQTPAAPRSAWVAATISF